MFLVDKKRKKIARLFCYEIVLVTFTQRLVRSSPANTGVTVNAAIKAILSRLPRSPSIGTFLILAVLSLIFHV